MFLKAFDFNSCSASQNADGREESFDQRSVLEIQSIVVGE